MPLVQISPEAMIHKEDAPYARLLREAGFDIQYPKDPSFARGRGTDDETIAELQGVSAVIATAENYNEKVIDALPDLRVIARAGVGYDRVDISSATKHSIPVTITPTANHEAVAELALALLFGVTKRVVENDAHTRAGRWPRTPLYPIRGNTMGILGLGRIGRSLAVRAIALGMKVIATEMYPQQDFVKQHNIELVDLDTLLARSDFISVHCPLTPQTKGMFDKEAFAKMKQGSILLNTARGPLVCEADLLEALKSGHLRGAGLDVFETEPPSPDNPLFALDNVVVSPHIAGADELSLECMGVEAAECIAKLYQGQWPDGAVVNDELRNGWKW